MPFPYADQPRLEREMSYGPSDFGFETETEWTSLLADALNSESDRIDGWTHDDLNWHDEDDTVPFVIEAMTIRLARQYVASIHEDGLSSQSLPSGASTSYRPPEDLRAEVKRELVERGYRETDDPSNDFVLTR